MKERPILFSAPMVRALLDGSKTQTRRVAKVENTMGHASITGPRKGKYSRVYLLDREHDLRDVSNACPYGQPGDRLWVKETHWRDDEDGSILYAANPLDWSVVQQNKLETGSSRYNWKPSIFMRRSASRITLEITGVRVERLQDISEVDALAEGISSLRSQAWDMKHFPAWRSEFDSALAIGVKPPLGPLPSVSFAALWESINGPGSWHANPWIWVIEFKVVKP